MNPGMNNNAAGELKEDRVELFEKLLDLCGEYRRVNQWK